MIIDGHVHIGKSEKRNDSYTFDFFINYMNKNNIDKIIAMPNISTEISFFELNKIFIKEYNKVIEKERIFPFLLIDPSNKLTIKQIEKENIYGVKYHPSISRYHINDNILNPVLEICRKKKIPILVHCGRDKISSIKYLIIAAMRNPDINFIGAHLGGNATDLIEEALALLSNNKISNIYLDTSAGKLPSLIEYAVRVMGKEKIIFGSDEPYADFRIEKICVELTDLSKEIKECIFYKNISLLLRLGNVYKI